MAAESRSIAAMNGAFTNTEVRALAGALPPAESNPIGCRARAVLANRIRSALPGNEFQLFGQGHSFRSIFFPGYSLTDGETQLNSVTGLNDAFWHGFSVAALCQEIRIVTNHLRPQMSENTINGALASYNKNLRNLIARWYGYIAAITEGVIKGALAAFPDDRAKASAKQQYIQGLTSDSWISFKVAMYGSGQWPDRDWELFHHWVKLTTVGASDVEIDQAITTAQAKGLPIPSDLTARNWRTWTRWLIPDIGGPDLGDANGPILETTYMATFVESGPVLLQEGNSYEFTSINQPGSPYRQSPSGSCFAPGAMVVMGDGSLKTIETIRAGEQVMTPAGPRSVLSRVAPTRGERKLHRFQGGGFSFTATHPFCMNESTGAAYASVDADQLAHALPTLSQFGIRCLHGAAAAVLNRFSPSGAQPFSAPAVEVAPEPFPDLLYDLVLDFGEDGISEYYVGDRNNQVLVSTEMPRFLSAPYTAATVVHILQQCSDEILDVLKAVPPEATYDLLTLGLQSVSHALLPAIGKKLTEPATNLVQGKTIPVGLTSQRALCDEVRRFAEQLQAGNEVGRDQGMAALLDVFLSCFGTQLHAVIAKGWRSFDLTDGTRGGILAVTPYAFEVFDGTIAMPPEPTMLRITLARGGEESVQTLAVEDSASRHRCYYTTRDVAYFSNWQAIDDPPEEAVAKPLWELRISVQSPDGLQIAPCLATVKLPWQVRHGFRMFRAPVLDTKSSVCGHVDLDVRTLSTRAEEQERAAHAAWQPAQEVAIAARLSQLGADFIINNFRRSAAALQTKAASPAAYKATLVHGVQA